MATGPTREGLEGARLPDSVAVINVVAVPLSGTVARRAYGGYRVLRRQGPNDGAVLLADALWPGGANLVALGSDHFLADFQEDTRVWRCCELWITRWRCTEAGSGSRVSA